MINWIGGDERTIFEGFEENIIPNNTVYIEYESTLPVNVKITSSQLSTSLSLNVDYNTNRIYLNGTLPKVLTTTFYYFTIRLESESEILDGSFNIIVNNLPRNWNSPVSYTSPATTNINIQFSITNPNGNEIYQKISGTLPTGLYFGESGSLYGTLNKINESSKTFSFTIGVFDNILNSPIITQIITYTVLNETSIEAPIWITEGGLIGNVNYNNNFNYQLLAYDTNNNTITYTVTNPSDLPYNITLNSTTGLLSGLLENKESRNWNFTVSASNGLYSTERNFILKTNADLIINEIIFPNPEDIDDAFVNGIKIGDYLDCYINVGDFDFTMFIEDGELPSGLTLENDGHLYGRIKYQSLGNYSFTILAQSNNSLLSHEYTLNVLKGLGKNACKAYLYINMASIENTYSLADYTTQLNAYKNWCITNDVPFDNNLYNFDYIFKVNEYDELLGKLNFSSRYKPYLEKYQSNSQPQIFVCTLNCVDKILMKYLLSFGTPLVMTIEDTKSLSKSDYEIIYKSLNEQTESINTLTIEGSRIYVTPDVTVSTGYITEQTHQIVQPTSAVIQSGNRYYFKMPSTTVIKIANTNNIRELLSYKQYVTKKMGTFYVNMLTQQIVPISSTLTEEFTNPYVFELENEEYVLININDDDIKLDENNLQYIQLMDENSSLPVWQETYFPTIDLLFCDPYTNITNLKTINDSEKNEDNYWYKRNFIFYELICSPLWSNEISQFAIPFYDKVEHDTISTEKKKYTFTINATLGD